MQLTPCTQHLLTAQPWDSGQRFPGTPRKPGQVFLPSSPLSWPCLPRANAIGQLMKLTALTLTFCSEPSGPFPGLSPSPEAFCAPAPLCRLTLSRPYCVPRRHLCQCQVLFCAVDCSLDQKDLEDSISSYSLVRVFFIPNTEKSTWNVSPLSTE